MDDESFAQLAREYGVDLDDYADTHASDPTVEYRHPGVAAHGEYDEIEEFTDEQGSAGTGSEVVEASDIP